MGEIFEGVLKVVGEGGVVESHIRIFHCIVQLIIDLTLRSILIFNSC